MACFPEQFRYYRAIKCTKFVPALVRLQFSIHLRNGWGFEKVLWPQATKRAWLSII